MFFKRFNTSTRLIILLTLAVSVVMAVATYVPLREREKSLHAAAIDEVKAHAVTLKIALEEDFATGRQLDAQRLINRLSENTGVYGVILFDEQGEIALKSESLKRADIRDLSEASSAITEGH